MFEEEEIDFVQCESNYYSKYKQNKNDEKSSRECKCRRHFQINVVSLKHL